MKFKAPKPDEIKVRRRVRGAFPEDVPERAQALYDSLIESCKGRAKLSFSVPRIPPTVNHMYVHSFRKTILTDDARQFRDFVAVAIGSSRSAWKPTGAVAALIFLQSPHWVTKRGTIRDMDGDNRIKPIFDAVEAATGARDCATWEIHAFKVASGLVKTSVYLFDLGDLIDFFP